ncbi:chemotaxis protein CheA [Anaeromyxobacter dehalogenans]|uniref:Chemotaxis protein CheA n=1 Tax=Anaeromyxobacter dehalogenans (strain 2CP-C) TaxID=290397 RepID=Q2IHL8_ANADE|nr:chemotaxis protein CheA [Anaeromyxobacter dehalogenans]ABC84079.1 CheA signal transduction histidine kinase [Anaeromyxobacter dehalogenans 2CP-C]
MDLQKYLSLYVAESSEHLAGYGRDLVEIERAVREGRPVKATIDSLFRHAHSVKGMSAAMAFDGIATLAHKAEDLVDVFRGEPGRLDAAAVDVLLAAGDALAAMVQGAGRGEKPEPDAALVARVVEAARRCRAGEPAAPAAGDPFAAQPAAPASPPAAPAPAAPPAADPAAGPAPAEPAPRAHRRVQVEVDIAPGCPVPAVRAFLVVKKLAALGAVARSAPTVEDLKAGRIPGKRLEVELHSPEPLAALERALAQISDLAAVAVREAAAAPPLAAAPAAPAPAPAREAPAEPARTVRVKTEILDGFLDAVGELILATARIREVGRGLPRDVRAPLDEGVDRLHAIVKDLHDKVMTVRMTPLALVTERLPRVVRDLARAVNKQVELDVQGAEIEIDRAILEELSDPLQHVLRNAVDHGIEPTHLRLLAGKPATGRLALTARRERDRVILEVSDDGRGLDPERLRQAAVARGVLAPEQAAALSDREALMLCCLPGVSTAEQVTELSGRGVGMDSVKRTVEALGGTLEVESAPGVGARVTFRLPLTVAVQPVLLVRVGEEVLGLPIAKVHGAAQVELSRLDRSRGEPVLPYDGELVPVRDLSRLLGFPAAAGDVRAVVVAEGGEPGRVGLAVDALLGQHEAVLKPLGSPLELVPGLSAVTVLGTGRPVFILDVQRLFA